MDFFYIKSQKLGQKIIYKEGSFKPTAFQRSSSYERFKNILQDTCNGSNMYIYEINLVCGRMIVIMVTTRNAIIMIGIIFIIMIMTMR